VATTWVVYAAVAAVALAAADVFVKMAAGRLPNSLGMLLYGAVAFGVGLTWFVADRVRGDLERASTAGVLYAVGVGAAFSTVAVALYVAFRAGAPLSITSPAVRLSGLIVASVCGVLIWSEPVTPRYVAGVGLATAGVYLIVTR
jgi:drug/metabolite transporter (DMT)-like permease